MTIPSWLPTPPADAPDFDGTYQRSFPAQFPRGLRAEGTEVEKDRQVMGSVMSWGALARWWLARAYLPQNDSEGLFLHLWEACFRMTAASSLAARVVALVAKFRERGTLTIGRAKLAMAACFGSSDPAVVEVTFAAAADVAAACTAAKATAQVWAEDMFQLHFYSATGAAAPDQAMFASLAARIAPVVDVWTAGKWQYAAYNDTDGPGYDNGGYNEACYYDADT